MSRAQASTRETRAPCAARLAVLAFWPIACVAWGPPCARVHAQDAGVPAAAKDAGVSDDANSGHADAGTAEPGAVGPPARETPAPPPTPPPTPSASTRPTSPTSRMPSMPAPDAKPAPPVATSEEEIVVIGTPIEHTAGSAHVLSEKHLERGDYDDPHAVLVSVPGVYVRGEDGVGLRPNVGLRGVNPDRSKKVTLLEDGVLFGPAPYSAPAAYYFPVMTRMTEVRVVKGPGAVAYGPQTVGGAIDLATRPIPAGRAGAVDLALGEYGYRKAHAYFGSRDGPTGFLIEGVHLGSDGFKHLPDGGDTGFYRNEWMFKGSHAVDDENELRLKLTYADELSNETYLGLTDADFRADPFQRYAASKLDRMRNHRISGVFSHEVELGDDATLSTDVYRHDFFRVWRKVNAFRGADLFSVLTDPESPRNAVFLATLHGDADSASSDEALLIGPNQRDFVSQGAQSRLRWDADTGSVEHGVEFGVRLHHDRIDREHSEDGFLIAGGDPVPEGAATSVTTSNRAFSYALAVHALDAVAWRSLIVTPGVRIEAIRSGLDDRLTGDETRRWAHGVLPGVGAFYGITHDFGVLAGAYRGFSPPVPGSGRDVEPELSVNYEAGARFHRRAVRVELIGFYNDYTNLTDVCTLSSGCDDSNLDRQFDAGEARIYGVEAFADLEPRLGTLTLPVLFAYTLTHAEFLAGFQSDDPIFGAVERGDEMPYVPRHQLAGTLGVEHERGGGSVSVGYVSAMREEAGSDPLARVLATDEQIVIDLGARVRVLGPWEVYVHARNVANAHYIVSRRPFGARPNAPRWIQVGTKVAF